MNCISNNCLVDIRRNALDLSGQRRKARQVPLLALSQNLILEPLHEESVVPGLSDIGDESDQVLLTKYKNNSFMCFESPLDSSAVEAKVASNDFILLPQETVTYGDERQPGRIVKQHSYG